MYRPYSVFTPDYDPTSGGIKVMWALYGYLLSRGMIVSVNCQYTNPDFVAIYPEIVKGNPLGAKTVVRYILAKPGEMALHGEPGPTEFDKNDKMYSFSRFIYPADNNHTMFLPAIDTNLFRDKGNKVRTKKCVFVGKGENTFVHPKECIEFDRRFARDQESLCNFLNECEVMYCYDFRTAMTEVARLCGCRVVIIPSRYTKQQFQNYEPGMNGISWGLDENVPLESKGFRKHYLSLRMDFSHKLTKFIEDTQK